MNSAVGCYATLGLFPSFAFLDSFSRWGRLARRPRVDCGSEIVRIGKARVYLDPSFGGRLRSARFRCSN
jgi:hypothetical protein